LFGGAISATYTGKIDVKAPELTPVQSLPQRRNTLKAEAVSMYWARKMSSHPMMLRIP
jgi:hypothetical protein